MRLPLFLLLGFAVLTVGLLILSGPVLAADGEAVFKSKGCTSCHFRDKGMDKKPYPSKERMAKLSFGDFKAKVKNGVSGTMMTGYNIGDGDMKAMHNWLQKFK